MPFNKKIDGYKNEYEFISYLNNKKVKEVNPIFQDLLYTIFDNINDNDSIICKPNLKKQKSDMFVIIKNQTKEISIKKGIKNSVHVEHINDFKKFLKQNGMSKELMTELLLFQYADGTIDNTGKNRISSEEYKQKYQDKLDKINNFFNNEKLIIKAVNRFVLQGNISDRKIDALIYGVIDDFVWITAEEIEKVIISNKDIKHSGLAFGSLFYQPMNRCLNYNPKYEHDRNFIQIKWYHLSDDIIKVMNDRIKII